MISIKEDDLVTLDDDAQYLVLKTIKEFNSTFHLLVGYIDDEERFDLEDLAFVEEVKEDGDVYLEPVRDPNKIQKLGSFILASEAIDAIPGLDKALLDAIEEKIN